MSSAAQDAVQRAQEIAARLSNESSKRKRWGDMPESKKSKTTTSDNSSGSVKRLWITVSKERPAAHYVDYLKDKLQRLAETHHCEILLKGKGSSETPPLPGVPEEPLHIYLSGKNSMNLEDVLQIVETELQQADAAPVSEAIQEQTQQQIVATNMSFNQLSQYKPASVSSMIGTALIDPTLPPDKLKAALLHNVVPNAVLDMQIPNGVVGYLIGKGGETIASLQAQSNCKVQIQKESEMKVGDKFRNITISGHDQQSVDTCRNLITAVIEQRVGKLGNHNHNNSNSGETVKMQVPNADIGLIIGKMGSTIKHIQQTTNSNITVPKVPDPDNPSVRTILIANPTLEGAQAAQTMINDVLGSSKSFSNEITLHVPIPDTDVGLCIGKQGSVIKYMQNTANVRIQIPQMADPGSYHRTATIHGTQEGCELAKKMINRIIQDQSSVAVTSGAILNEHSNSAEWAAYHAANTNTTVNSTEYHEQFFRYAYYYGEEAARAYYGAWAPPVGTVNPYGVNPNPTAPPPATTNGAATTATTTAAATTTASVPVTYAPAPGASYAAAPSTSYAAAPVAAEAPAANATATTQVKETSRRHVSNLPAWMNKGNE